MAIQIAAQPQKLKSYIKYSLTFSGHNINLFTGKYFRSFSTPFILIWENERATKRKACYSTEEAVRILEEVNSIGLKLSTSPSVFIPS